MEDDGITGEQATELFWTITKILIIYYTIIGLIGTIVGETAKEINDWLSTVHIGLTKLSLTLVILYIIWLITKKIIQLACQEKIEETVEKRIKQHKQECRIKTKRNKK